MLFNSEIKRVTSAHFFWSGKIFSWESDFHAHFLQYSPHHPKSLDGAREAGRSFHQFKSVSKYVLCAKDEFPDFGAKVAVPSLQPHCTDLEVPLNSRVVMWSMEYLLIVFSYWVDELLTLLCVFRVCVCAWICMCSWCLVLFVCVCARNINTTQMNNERTRWVIRTRLTGGRERTWKIPNIWHL